jgi:hypothetical protein
MNMTLSSAVARLSGEDSLDRVAAIAPVPLLPGEQEAEYATLAARIVAAAQPRDVIEELLTRDVVDLTWEIFRLRRAKTGILKASMSAGLDGVLRSLGHWELAGQHLSQEWAAGYLQARKKVDGILRKAGLTIEDVTARTLDSKIENFERLDRMLGSAEARRNNALREIERHREALGAAMRKAIDEVQDAEFRDVETGAPGGETSP